LLALDADNKHTLEFAVGGLNEYTAIFGVKQPLSRAWQVGLLQIMCARVLICRAVGATKLIMQAKQPWRRLIIHHLFKCRGSHFP